MGLAETGAGAVHLLTGHPALAQQELQPLQIRGGALQFGAGHLLIRRRLVRRRLCPARTDSLSWTGTAMIEPGTRLEMSTRWACSWALSVSSRPQCSRSHRPPPITTPAVSRVSSHGRRRLPIAEDAIRERRHRPEATPWDAGPEPG